MTLSAGEVVDVGRDHRPPAPPEQPREPAARVGEEQDEHAAGREQRRDAVERLVGARQVLEHVAHQRPRRSRLGQLGLVQVLAADVEPEPVARVLRGEGARLDPCRRPAPRRAPPPCRKPTQGRGRAARRAPTRARAWRACGGRSRAGPPPPRRSPRTSRSCSPPRAPRRSERRRAAYGRSAGSGRCPPALFRTRAPSGSGPRRPPPPARRSAAGGRPRGMRRTARFDPPRAPVATTLASR